MEKELFCMLCAEKTKHEVIEKCICNEDQGADYTYQDEYGNCNYCLGEPCRCLECNSTRKLVEMIDNFEYYYQIFISNYEHFNWCKFIGCAESDDSLVFRLNRDGKLKLIDVELKDGIVTEIDYNKLLNNERDEVDFENISDEELDRWDI